MDSIDILKDIQEIPSEEEEVSVEKKHKIDPKKLIIYSEIMKAKFDE